MPDDEPSDVNRDYEVRVMEVLLSEYSDDISLDEEEMRDLFQQISNIGRLETQTWSPPRPSSSEFIWRYLNFTQLLSILERDKIWFNNIDRFEDPYEGTIPRQNLQSEIERISGSFDIPREFVLNIYKQAPIIPINTAVDEYVNCWNMNEYQSAALWEQYVDSQEGVAIRTTVSQLDNALEPADMDFVIGNVKYIDYDEDEIPLGDLPSIYHKRQSFEHENEFRISYISKGGNESLGAGFYAKVDKDILIESIVISPVAPDWFSDLVERVLEQYQLDCELIESGLYSDPEIDLK